MNNFPFFLSLLSVTTIYQSICFQFDQEFIEVDRFFQLMPCLDEYEVDKLVDYLNGVPDESLRIQEVNRWLDKNWIPASEFIPNKHRKKCDTYISHKQVDKNWIRYQLITFVRQRTALRAYVEFMYGATRDLGFFNETEAKEMRDTFWRIDKSNSNFFMTTEWDFLEKSNYGYEETNKNVTAQLSILAGILKMMPDYDKLLEWNIYQDL